MKKKNLKLLAVLLSFSVLGFNYGFAQDLPLQSDIFKKRIFRDVNENEIEGIAANYFLEKGVISGKENGEFQGEDMVNRAELAKILLLANETEVGNEKNDGVFSDVENGSWYEKYVMKAQSLGVVNGYESGEFKPEKAVNTAEFLKMLAKTFNISTDTPNTYKDVPGNAWYDKFAGIAEKNNLFPHREEGYLNPTKELTRNEVVVAIYKYLKQNPRKKLLITQRKHSNKSLTKKPQLPVKEKTVSKVKSVKKLTPKNSHKLESLLTKNDRTKINADYFELSYLSDWEVDIKSNEIITVSNKIDYKDISSRAVLVGLSSDLPKETRNLSLDELMQAEYDIIKLVAKDFSKIYEKETVLAGIKVKDVFFKFKKENAVFYVFYIKGVKDNALYAINLTITEKLFQEKGKAYWENEFNNIKKSFKIYPKKEAQTGTEKITAKKFELEVNKKWQSFILDNEVKVNMTPEDEVRQNSEFSIDYTEVNREYLNKSQKELFNYFERNFLENFEKLEKIKEENVVLDGRSFESRTFNYKVDKEVGVMKFMIHKNKDDFYHITFLSPQKDFDAKLVEFEKAISTLKFK